MPTGNLQALPNSTFLPSLDDQNSLLSDFVVLVGRVIVENLPAFAIFKDVIPLHIKHKYSEELKKKTETVSDWLKRAMHSITVYLDLKSLKKNYLPFNSGLLKFLPI